MLHVTARLFFFHMCFLRVGNDVTSSENGQSCLFIDGAKLSDESFSMGSLIDSRITSPFFHFLLESPVMQIFYLLNVICLIFTKDLLAHFKATSWRRATLRAARSSFVQRLDINESPVITQRHRTALTPGTPRATKNCSSDILWDVNSRSLEYPKSANCFELKLMYFFRSTKFGMAEY